MAQWLALLPHSVREPGSIAAPVHCVEFAHSPLVCGVRLIGHAKLTLSVRGLAG